jgi:predicted O-methyltransferase YrrM
MQPPAPQSLDPSQADGLNEPAVRSVLDRLHRAAQKDRWKLLRIAPRLVTSILLGKELPPPSAFKDIYIPVSAECGRFLYLVGRSLGARRVVEFGTSFGISTIYLAAAVRDNGGGKVFGTEIEENKAREATKNLEQAGLAQVSEVLLGDALKTLSGLEAPIDYVLLDGWKDLYMPVLQLLTPKLRKGAVVIADNIFTFRKALAPYVQHVQSGRNGFTSMTLPMGAGFEYSVYVGES